MDCGAFLARGYILPFIGAEPQGVIGAYLDPFHDDQTFFHFGIIVAVERFEIDLSMSHLRREEYEQSSKKGKAVAGK